MPNGENGRYNSDWCREKHKRIDKQFEECQAACSKRFAEVWGEEHGGIKAIWNRMDNLNMKLWSIIGMQLVILGGIVATLLRLSI